MLPFTMRCKTCGAFTYRRRTFNARKQITSDNYLSIPIIRFYIRCPECTAEITFKTDPQNGDYQCEAGATRNAQLYPQVTKRDEGEDRENEAIAGGEEDHEADPLAVIERKIDATKTEMKVNDGLDALRSANARRERRLQEPAAEESKHEQDAKDAEIARQAFRSATARQKEAEMQLEPDPSSAPVSWARTRKRKKEGPAGLRPKGSTPHRLDEGSRNETSSRHHMH